MNHAQGFAVLEWNQSMYSGICVPVDDLHMQETKANLVVTLAILTSNVSHST